MIIGIAIAIEGAESKFDVEIGLGLVQQADIGNHDSYAARRGRAVARMARHGVDQADLRFDDERFGYPIGDVVEVILAHATAVSRTVADPNGVVEGELFEVEQSAGEFAASCKCLVERDFVFRLNADFRLRARRDRDHNCQCDPSVHVNPPLV